MADTPTSETVTPEAPSNNASPVVTPAPAATPAPQSNATDTADVERLRKEQEQKDLRIRQLENEKAARDKADEEARQKKLEEENNYKELLEQERAKREALEADAEARATTEALNKAKAEALSGYSEEVKTLAEEVGLNLTAVDETAVEEFKGKLTKLSERVSSEARVGANNPNQPGGKVEFTAEQLRNGALEDGKAFHDLVTAKYPGIAAMTSKPK
jgi:membrane protein involved in colicin uptake